LAALIGGALLVVVDVLDGVFFFRTTEAAAMGSTAWIIFDVLDVLLLVLLSLGVVGIYLYQAKQTGALGMIGFLVFFFGLALMSGAVRSSAFILPWLAVAAPPELLAAEPTGVLYAGFLLTIVLLALGGLLYGLASLRAGVLPRGASVLLMIAAVLAAVMQFLEIPFAGVFVGAALAWMGYALWYAAADEPDAIPDMAI